MWATTLGSKLFKYLVKLLLVFHKSIISPFFSPPIKTAVLFFREFCKMVKRICIYSSEEVKKMSPRCKLPMSSIDGEGTILSSESQPKSEA